MLSVSEYLETVREVVSDGARRAYEPYWAKLEHGFERDGKVVFAFGATPLNQVKPTALAAGAKLAGVQAVRRRGHREGASATEHYVGAARVLWQYAVRDKLVTENPAREVSKPPRQPSRRHALSAMQLSELWVAAAEGGNDPALDVLLLRFHQETGARREGALNLVRGDVHESRQTLTLREKGGTDREQPISGTLLRAILEHYRARSPQPKDSAPVLYYRDRTPLTRRRYNTLFERLQRDVPWAGELGVSVHWLRHTSITTVERITSYAVAQKFAGHRPAGATGTYSKASITEVAAAVALLTGEPHPLAPQAQRYRPEPW